MNTLELKDILQYAENKGHDVKRVVLSIQIGNAHYEAALGQVDMSGPTLELIGMVKEG